MELVELEPEVPAGVVGGVLGEPDEEQGEPAEQDVRADPRLLAVVDRTAQYTCCASSASISVSQSIAR